MSAIVPHSKRHIHSSLASSTKYGASHLIAISSMCRTQRRIATFCIVHMLAFWPFSFILLGMKTNHYFQKRLNQASSLLVPVLCLLNNAQQALAQQPGGAPAAGGGAPHDGGDNFSVMWIPGLIIGVVAGGIFFFIQSKKKQ